MNTRLPRSVKQRYVEQQIQAALEEDTYRDAADIAMAVTLESDATLVTKLIDNYYKAWDATEWASTSKGTPGRRDAMISVLAEEYVDYYTGSENTGRLMPAKTDIAKTPLEKNPVGEIVATVTRGMTSLQQDIQAIAQQVATPSARGWL